MLTMLWLLIGLFKNLIYLRSDLLSAYCLLGAGITKMSKAQPLPLKNL